MSLFRHDIHESSSDEYATPKSFVEPIANAVDGFDLDPASGAEDVSIAPTVYTEKDNGLDQEWFGTVWLNPPFSDKEDWLKKALTSVQDNHADLVVALLPVDSSAGWFHEYVVEADVIGFKRGRLNFIGGNPGSNSPNFGVMVVVFGETPDDLVRLLSRRGEVFFGAQRYAETYQQELIP